MKADAIQPLVERGLKVFPLVNADEGKLVPALKSFQSKASDIIPEHAPGAGVATEASGLVVVDIDTKNGDGESSLADWQLLHGELPKTLTVRTPSGGRHLYYYGATRSRIGWLPSVDIKSAGGYVVGPGSARAQGEYVVEVDAPIAPAPEYLTAHIGAPREHKEEPAPIYAEDAPECIQLAVAYLLTEPGAIEGESGDITTYRTACHLKDLGVSPATALSLLLEYYNPKCIPEWTREELAAKVRNAWNHGTSQPGVNSPGAMFKTSTWHLFRESDIPEDELPPRRWILDGFLARGFISALISPGGVGKSTLTNLIALSVASSDKVKCGYTVHESCPVWLHNAEDAEDECTRRMRAFRVMHGTEKGLPIWISSGRKTDINFAAMVKGNMEINKKAFADLREEIILRGIGLLILDPFVQVHHIPENDNGHMAALMKEFQNIVEELDIAILLVHHTRKSRQGDADGDADLSRGASAVINACRSAISMRSMSAQEAAKLAIPDSQRHWFVRVDNAKSNFAAPAEKAQWYKRESILLPNGDSVGVLGIEDGSSFEAGAITMKEQAIHLIGTAGVTGKISKASMVSLLKGGGCESDPVVLLGDFVEASWGTVKLEGSSFIIERNEGIL